MELRSEKSIEKVMDECLLTDEEMKTYVEQVTRLGLHRSLPLDWCM